MAYGIANIALSGLNETRTQISSLQGRLGTRTAAADAPPAGTVSAATLSAPSPALKTFGSAVMAQSLDTQATGRLAGTAAAPDAAGVAAAALDMAARKTGPAGGDVGAAPALDAATEADVAALQSLEQRAALTRSLFDVVRTQDNGVRRLFGIDPEAGSTPDAAPVAMLQAAPAAAGALPASEAAPASAAPTSAGALAQALSEAAPAAPASAPAEAAPAAVPAAESVAAVPAAESAPAAPDTAPSDPTGGWKLFFQSGNTARETVVSEAGGNLARGSAQWIALAAGTSLEAVDLGGGYNTFDATEAGFVGSYTGGKRVDEVLIGTAGIGSVATGGGDDVLLADGHVGAADLGEGDDYVVLKAGGSANGGAGNDTLQDGDMLNGADVASVLEGGEGDDTLNVYVTDSTPTQRDSFDGGAGTDTVTIRIKSAYTGEERIGAIIAELDGLLEGGAAPTALETLNLDLAGIERINLVVDGKELRSIGF